MRKIIVALCVIAAWSVVALACSRDRDWYGHEYGRGDSLRVLWDRRDCPDYYPSLGYPGEFFGLSEFRRGHDELYGDRRTWRDEDYSSFRDRDCYHCRNARHEDVPVRDRARRAGGYDPEGAFSERYSPRPPALPDMEYDQ